MTLALERMDHRPLLPRGSEPPLSQGEGPPRPAGEERACPPCTSFFSSSCLVSANHRIMVSFIVAAVFTF